ncbi:Methyltransferase [Sphaerulina musiva]
MSPFFLLQHDMGSFAEDGFSGRTLATTTTMYRHENGRTYHAYRDGEYWQPNDEKQNNHEAIVHHLCILTLRDQLFLAPVTNPTRILDIGTGTGIWATDIADRFPSAEVIGTDLSPVQPGMQPDNCHFEIDDCMAEWVYPESHFDFIHIRGLFGSISDWPTLYQQCYSHLQPGGWIEQVEWSIQNRSADGSLRPNSTLAKWSMYGIECGRRLKKTFKIAEEMAGMITSAGFVDVVEKRFKWPIGPWSSDPRLKEIGRWNLLNWEEGMEGWVIAPYTRVLGWSAADVQEWLAEIRKALRDRKKHVYHEVRLVYARKPFDHEMRKPEEATSHEPSKNGSCPVEHREEAQQPVAQTNPDEKETQLPLAETSGEKVQTALVETNQLEEAPIPLDQASREEAPTPLARENPICNNSERGTSDEKQVPDSAAAAATSDKVVVVVDEASIRQSLESVDIREE